MSDLARPYDDVVLTPIPYWDEDTKEDAIKYQVDQLHRQVIFLRNTLAKKWTWTV